MKILIYILKGQLLYVVFTAEGDVYQFKLDLITSVEILGCTTLKKKKLLPQF